VSAARSIHLVGIGGAGMSGLARLAHDAGYRVSGTDRDDSATLRALAGAGIAARAGHGADALPEALDALVVSTAVAADNPELVAARERGIPVLHRADLLAELMRGRRGIAVAGAHGKSTTTALLALALGDPAVCVGASIDGGAGTGARWGADPFFVAEADESDRSLLRLAPEAAILLNVDHDHHATFASIDEVREVFVAFLGALPADGLVVAGPDADARACAAAAPCAARAVGDVEGAFCRVEEVAPDGPFTLALADGRRVRVPLPAAGVHNAQNAACALAMADWCGVPVEEGAARLAGYRGIGRRFEPRGAAGGVRVVDDYAHHPAELRATLAAARAAGAGRIVAIFQPHLYSRTAALGDELGAALGAADVAIVTEIYGAREDPVPGVSGQAVVDAVPAPTTATFAPTLEDAAAAALAVARPGDLILTLGAGDVTRLGQELVAALQKHYGDGEDRHGRGQAA
jgi:UDP-N-acetylmuramate--alanine ligase